MFRRLLLSAAFVAVAAPAYAASCDINADQAAVVAAWGEKVKANSLPAEQLANISERIQNLPTLASSDEEAACAELQALKTELGFDPPSAMRLGHWLRSLLTGGLAAAAPKP